ncbi:MAG: PD40 domain-containing protein [Chloroflexi bacterium]|nr:PD40 domain-containing protein [Chloroflexota bacterium]
MLRLVAGKQKWLFAAVAITALLVPASPLDAATPSRFFDETAHDVSGDFLMFFESFGGLDIFGYPLTDETVEGGRTVQYFQRARMELWPENPWPYRVQLGLLAVELGRGQPGLGYQPVATANVRYFSETGHTVAFDFKGFWEGNGGVGIFGYPITEQLVENGLLVQYFQRARFERHPDKAGGYRVQLGLLGEEYLQAKGKQRQNESRENSSVSSSMDGPTGLIGRIVFQSATGGMVFVMNAGEDAPVPIGTGIDPSWSPDGTHIAFAQWGYPSGIYFVSADGGEKRRLFDVEEAQSPVWAPDGSRIAFVKHYQDWIFRTVRGQTERILQDYWAIKVLRLGDGKISDLPFNDPGERSPQPQSFSPSWSPDSKRIVFDGIRGLYISSEDGAVTHIPNTDTRFASPAWSPDGQRITFMYRQHDHWEIGTIGPDGNGFRLLTSSPPFVQPAENVSPAWSPDSGKIAFVSNREGAWKIHVMDADGSRQQKLSDAPVSYNYANERMISWVK